VRVSCLTRSLHEATVLVIGAVRTAVACRLSGFGVELVGVRAHPERGGPPGVQEVAGPHRLTELLSRADVVVRCAMHDPANAGTLGARDSQR
jgi:phosphoglycerate dehydrogenase-like enzyme